MPILNTTMRLLGCWLLVGLLWCAACGGGDEEDDTADDDAAADDDNAADDDIGDDDAADDDATPPEYTETCPDGPVLPFDLNATPRVVPYPNDWYTVPDAASPSGRRVRIDENTARPLGALAANPLLGFLVSAYNDLTGFSTLADIYLPVGVEPAAAALPDEVDPALTDAFFLLVDDAASPHDGELAPLVAEYRAPDLHLTPWFPLYEKTHYLLVATRQLRPVGGCFRASASMREIWTAWAAGDGSAPYTAALDRLNDLGVAPGRVLSLAEFTTGWITGEMEAAVGVLQERAETAPSSFRDWEIVPDADPRLWATAHAVFDVPVFKPDGAAWELDDAGVPVVDHLETVRAYFTIPAADQPSPLLVFAHGMFNDKHEMTPPFTTEIAAQGWAMVAIDAVCHGDRLEPGTGEIGQMLCFYDVFHPGAWRDNFRESAADLVWLTYALSSLAEVDLDENGVPDFDVTRIYFMGASLGSILGGVFSAVNENVEAHVLTAAGAKLTSIVLEGEASQYLDWIALFEQWLLPGEPITDFLRLLMDMLQAVLDPADPANYVMHTNREPLAVMNGYQPQVLQQGAAYDDVVGGPSGGWLCRAGGWPQLTPFAWDVGAEHAPTPYSGSAFYQFDTEEHTLIFDTDPLSDATRAQIYHFLTTHLADEVGEIIDPLAAR